MGNESSLRVDHVGASLLAHFDLRHEIKDELEIDLGNADSDIAKGAGKRDGHIRFGFATKIDRPIIDLVRHRVYEAGMVGKVGIAANLIHCGPRNTQLLTTTGVELCELGDGGYLAEQTRSVELKLLGRACGLCHLSGPTELAFDFLNEATDLVSCRLRLLALDTGDVSTRGRSRGQDSVWGQPD